MSEPTKSQLLASQLKQYQALPLGGKIRLSLTRIQQWLDHWEDQCYVAFSGGKDSTVLLDLVWSINPRIPAVFVDTGLEYPEIREFVKGYGDRVVWLKPKMPFNQVIEKYGYPVISKEQSQFLHDYRRPGASPARRQTLLTGNNCGRGKISDKWKFLLDAPFKCSDRCCHVMKKDPSKRYEKETGRKPIIGTMASESQLRLQKYHKEGCMAFNTKRPTCTPLAFWYDSDVWSYIKQSNLPYSKIYDMGEDRTGCMFCMFGCHKDEVNRFQRMKISHPKQWNYCINTLGCGKVLDFIGVDYGGAQ
jgi:3'-phosphoadenosine 5'-phosphosulfate sulfotransferase (PAPS reductase)/FAD synthetase